MRTRGSGTVAFVLAGGGSLGAVQVGMLAALTEAGVQPDIVVGASAGAINGLYFAADPTRGGMQRLGAVWRTVTKRAVYPWSVIGALLALFGYRYSLLDPMPFRRLLERHLPVRNVEDTTIPCHVTATDALSGAEVSIATGPASDALLASAAIPVLFPPVERAGRLLIDGGIANNTPISTAVQLGASRVIVLPTGFSCAITSPPRGAIAMMLHTFNLLVARQLVNDVERFRASTDIVVVPPLCPVGVSSYDFSHAGALMEQTEATTAAWIAQDGLARGAAIPGSLVPHSHGRTTSLVDVQPRASSISALPFDPENHSSPRDSFHPSSAPAADRLKQHASETSPHGAMRNFLWPSGVAASTERSKIVR
jgi:NTE family protein